MEESNKDSNVEMKANENSINSPVVLIEEKFTLINGNEAIRRYLRGKCLGKEGSAKSYEVTNLDTNEIQAVKIIPKNTLTKSRAKHKLISEIGIHQSLNHPSIVGFKHVFEDSANVYILLEACKNETLAQLLKRRGRLLEVEVQSYLLQIIAALKYLHTNRVIHRDLKPSNLYLNDKMELKLANFEFATIIEYSGEKKRSICGTNSYLAPEILEGKAGYSYEVDIWYLGVIIYMLLVGRHPFESPDVKVAYKNIKTNKYTFPEHVPLSADAISLIQKILVIEPNKRPTIDEILAHPFLNPLGVAIPGNSCPQENLIPDFHAETQPCTTNFLSNHAEFEKIIIGDIADKENKPNKTFNATDIRAETNILEISHALQSLPKMHSVTDSVSSEPGE